MKKILCFLVALLALKGALHAEKPLAGMGGLSSNTPRAAGLAVMAEERLQAIITSTEGFSLVNPGLLKSELIKFQCLEETCMLRLAGDSGISLFIRGDVEEVADEIVLTLEAFGTDLPFNGRRFHRYRASIKMDAAMSAGRLGLIMEEHSARFISGTLRRFSVPVEFSIKDGRLETPGSLKIQGTYTVYRRLKAAASMPVRCEAVGRIRAGQGAVDVSEYTSPAEHDFLLMDFSSQASYVGMFYRGRKREVVLQTPSLEEKLFAMAFTPVGSALMPVLSPFMGYYAAGDWPGLGLWCANALPYLCLEAKGFLKDPGDRRDNHRDVSRSMIADRRYAWYMLFSGGGGLFVDAFASQYLRNASGYRQEPQPYMGSDLLAGYLALATAGGGHFYRGYRGWGYAYFHADNLLMYAIMRELSPPERYDAAGGSYERGRVNTARAGLYIGALACLKIAEITHAVLLDDRISNGDVIEEGFSLSPLAAVDENRSLVAGMQCSFRF
jgi:hypothetical protein